MLPKFNPRIRTAALAFVLTVAGSLALGTPPASAKETDGLAIGAEAGLSNSGLSVKYAVGNVHFQLVLGTDVFVPEQIDRVDYNVAASIRLTYNIARIAQTNLWVGVGGTFEFRNDPVEGTAFEVGVTVEPMLGVEHFFNDFFAISGFLGLPIALNDRRDTIAADGETVIKAAKGVGVSLKGVGWGAGFHFYF